MHGSFTNENGLRVQKTINGVATKYTLHGKNVVHMTSGTDELHFFYDAQNRPAVVVYNGTAYAYVKSLQGDIVAILDENGNMVVSYGYDAWGAPLWCTGELAETLGKVQPFRYRGYVFDEETGLYYLRSRYYNPQWGRFVNADCLPVRNLFLYCSNSPLRLIDSNGTEDGPTYLSATPTVGEVLQNRHYVRFGRGYSGTKQRGYTIYKDAYSEFDKIEVYQYVYLSPTEAAEFEAHLYEKRIALTSIGNIDTRQNRAVADDLTLVLSFVPGLGYITATFSVVRHLQEVFEEGIETKKREILSLARKKAISNNTGVVIGLKTTYEYIAVLRTNGSAGAFWHLVPNQRTEINIWELSEFVESTEAQTFAVSNFDLGEW